MLPKLSGAGRPSPPESPINAIIAPVGSIRIAPLDWAPGVGEFEEGAGVGELEPPSCTREPEYAFGLLINRLTTNNVAPRNIKPGPKIDFFMGFFPLGQILQGKLLSPQEEIRLKN